MILAHWRNERVLFLTKLWISLGLILLALLQASDIMIMFLLSRAIGLNMPLVFFTIIPLVYLITILPISLGGLGVPAAALAFLLMRFGVATSEEVPLSLLVYLNCVVVGSLGLVLRVETLPSRQVDRVMKDAGVVGISSQEWSH